MKWLEANPTSEWKKINPLLIPNIDRQEKRALMRKFMLTGKQLRKLRIARNKEMRLRAA